MNTLDKDEIIASLQAEIEELRTILSFMPGNVFWKDINRRYTGCNNNVAALLNLASPNEIIGKTNSELLSPELAKKLAQIDLEIIQSKQEQSGEELAFNLEGPAVWLSKKKPLLNRQGKITGILGI